MNTETVPEIDDYHLCYELSERTHRHVFCDDLQLHVFQLPKFRKSLNELNSPQDQWLYLLRHSQTLDPDNVPRELQTPEILTAIEVIQMLTQDDAEFALYEARQKAINDRQTLLDHRDRLVEELDQVIAERDHLSEQRDHLSEQRDHLSEERDHLDKKLAQERDQFRSRLIEMIQFLEQREGLPLIPLENLSSLSREELDARLKQLQAKDDGRAESN